MNARLAATALVIVLLSAGRTPAALVLNNLSPYVQDFNTLAATGTNNTWTDNVTIVGWYWQGDGNGSGLGYIASDGSADSTRRYSFGSTGSTDRAMGAITLQGLQVASGIVFQNNSGQAINSITVAYTGEQWRRNSAPNDAIRFAYKASATDVTDFLPGDVAVPSGWTGVSGLDFGPPTPQVSIPPTEIDGNDPANRAAKSQTFSVSVPQGQFLVLRWFDTDVDQTDQGIGIDDLTVTFNPTAVPEPTAAIFGGLICGIVGIAAAIRRRFFS